MELSPLVLHQWTGLSHTEFKFSKICDQSVSFFPIFFSLKNWFMGFHNRTDRTPISLRLKFWGISQFALLWRFIRMPGIAWSTSWGAQKFSLSWRLLSHHALKDIDSLVSTAHKSGQSDVSHLTFQFRLTNQYSLIAKCMTASLCLNLTVMACWQKPTWTFTKLLTCWQMCVWSWSSWLKANND